MLQYANARLLVNTATLAPGSITMQAPSNIALVKYWGKRPVQLPQNPNASFTLSVARTITELAWQPRSNRAEGGVELVLYYDGQLKPAFADRIRTYFTSLLEVYPFIGQLAWTINTRNTFPHGAGIASSASAMAALAMCLVQLEHEWFDKLPEAESLRKASYIARLGSGSASRSVFAKAAAWGKSVALPDSSDEFAVPLSDNLHTTYHDYQDTILLVSAAEKSVSSSAGHSLMEGQAYAKTRYEIANRRFVRLLEILRKGELDDFCTLVEADALDLHALMMQSYPPYILMEPNTLAIVKAVQGFRQNTKLPVCFTLDAGPNVHLLYPKAIAGEVDAWLQSEIMHLLPQGSILDQVGDGPSVASL